MQSSQEGCDCSRSGPTSVLHTYLAFPPSTHYGGPTESTYQLCRALARKGLRVAVATSNADGPCNTAAPVGRWVDIDGIAVYYAKRIGKTLVVPRVFFGLRGAWNEASVVHLTGILSVLFPCVAVRCALLRMPLVVSTRGALLRGALERHSWKKWLYGATVGRLCYGLVDVYHATSDEEASDISAAIPGSKVVVVPNGVLVPEHVDAAPPTAMTRFPGRYLLYLGRVHPHKRVDLIVRAYGNAIAGIEPARRVNLWLAGAGSGEYVDQLHRLVDDLGLHDGVHFVGPVDGVEKERVLASAEALVLASQSENFGIVVAEALARATPCVVTRTAPWSGLEQHGCGYWVEDSEEAVTGGMQRMLSLTAEERREQGYRGREWMRRKFSWDVVANDMISVYRDLAPGKVCAD